MKRKLSKTALALVFFTLTLILSVAGIFMMVSTYHPSYRVVATSKLNYEPERYVLLENPDRYTLQAIDNGDSVDFYSYDDTNIDELNQANIAQFGFTDFYYKYNNSYYSIGIAIGDNIPPFGLPLLLLAGIIVSMTVIVIITSYKTVKYVRNRKVS